MVLTARSVSAAVLAGLLAGASALRGQGCPAAREERDLGFGGIDCLQCTVHQRDARTEWIEFGAEPIIRQVHAGGPADGKLLDGDVLVAVDGLPITTEAGGRRFAHPDTGKPLRLAVRRAGRNVTVEIVPDIRCGTEPDKLTPATGAPVPRERGWLGFGVQCSWCSSQRQPDGNLIWEFKDYPAVVAIDSTGPAVRTNLRPGDTLRAIDGFGLLTVEGGRRFGAIRPGDRVRLTVQRNGVQREIVVTASRHERTP